MIESVYIPSIIVDEGCGQLLLHSPLICEEVESITRDQFIAEEVGGEIVHVIEEGGMVRRGLGGVERIWIREGEVIIRT